MRILSVFDVFCAKALKRFQGTDEFGKSSVTFYSRNAAPSAKIQHNDVPLASSLHSDKQLKTSAVAQSICSTGAVYMI